MNTPICVYYRCAYINTLFISNSARSSQAGAFQCSHDLRIHLLAVHFETRNLFILTHQNGFEQAYCTSSRPYNFAAKELAAVYLFLYVKVVPGKSFYLGSHSFNSDTNAAAAGAVAGAAAGAAAASAAASAACI